MNIACTKYEALEVSQVRDLACTLFFNTKIRSQWQISNVGQLMARLIEPSCLTDPGFSKISENRPS